MTADDGILIQTNATEDVSARRRTGIDLCPMSKLNKIVSVNKFQEIEDLPFGYAHFRRNCIFMHNAGRGKFEEEHVTGCCNDVREYPGPVVYESHVYAVCRKVNARATNRKAPIAT